MANDPAFLFYDADASRDIRGMSRDERGAYFDFLLEQKQFGRQKLSFIKRLYGADFDKIWPVLERVLTYENDMYYISWLDYSISKRKEYSESRAKNRSGKGQKKASRTRKKHMLSHDKHMVNENAIENKDVIEPETAKENFGDAKVVSVHTTCKNFYVQFQQQNNRECNWNGKYAGSLSHILGKLKLTYSKSHGREPTEQEIYGSFEYLIKKLPDWYKDKELSIINSNYDSIVNEIKNGKPTTATGKKAGYTDSELIDGLEEYRRRNQVVNSK